MNIVSLKTDSGFQEYLLNEDDKIVLKLRYKNEVHIARLETETERRVLIIEDEGLLKTVLVLKNEYGVRIGSMNYDNFSASHGIVDIDNTKYRFKLSQDTPTELHIYKGSRRNLIYSCLLPVDDKNSKMALASLIISVAWYLFLKEERKVRHAFNDAIIL